MTTPKACKSRKALQASSAALAGVFLMGCTGQIAGSFRFQQAEQAFDSQQKVNTKIDLLWVVDNSSSMDVSQQKLRSGFQTFASKYMKPTWDIRVAVISTDTYMAHVSFDTYLHTVVPGSIGYTSAYLASRLGTLQNPSWNTSLINLSTGALTNGILYGELSPLWGSSYAKLVPGYHDGPLTTFCFEPMPYFFKSVTDCKVRDDQTGNTGIENCVNPGVGESSLSQCVNTIQNDTVHSGKPIISTMPPTGTAGDSAWITQLTRNFMVNVSKGSSGQGSERGLSSVLQLLNDNESTGTAFFRKNSLRGIIFVSDEDDQSMTIPSSPDPGYKPFFGYRCDQAGITALNGSKTSDVNGMCCNVPANNCSFGSLGLTCSPKTVDGYTYTLSICADTASLIPVATVKNTIDTFFQTLDGDSNGDPNYFVAAITPTTATAIQTLQTARTTSDAAVGTYKLIEVDRGDRYIQLGQLVGKDSLALDLSSSDYTPILDAIGAQIIQRKSTFTLERAPTGKEEMIVKVLHADGSMTVVPESYFTIQGKSLVFSNQDFVLSLSASDQIVINYQPKTAKGV